MTKVVFFDVDEQEQNVLRREFEGEQAFDLHFHRGSLDEQTVSLAEDAEGIGIFIQSHLTEEILNRLPRLRMIAAMSTGYDHVDLDTCRARGITVSNVPSYGDNTVAEYAFGLIIALARKLRPTFRRVERGEFSRAGLMGTDLKGKTLGLVGTGHIGSHMARLGWGFEMKVVAFDPHPKPALTEQYGVRFLPLEDLLREADVISLHVPYVPATHHLIDAEKLRMVKCGAFLINTSRGKVIDTAAVVAALREGRLGGAALDTFEGEQVWIEEEFLKRDDLAAVTLREAMESFSILQSDNALLSPHNAYNTEEALARILTTSADNIQAYFAGNPQNVVVGPPARGEQRPTEAHV